VNSTLRACTQVKPINPQQEAIDALADCLRVLCFPTVSGREESAAIDRAREVIRAVRKGGAL
jgi:hypothetical protein